MAQVSLEQLTGWRRELMELRASGIRRIVHQNGQALDYKTDGEMAAAIAALDSQISAATRNRAGRMTFQTSKGL